MITWTGHVTPGHKLAKYFKGHVKSGGGMASLISARYRPASQAAYRRSGIAAAPAINDPQHVGNDTLLGNQGGGRWRITRSTTYDNARWQMNLDTIPAGKALVISCKCEAISYTPSSAPYMSDGGGLPRYLGSIFLTVGKTTTIQIVNDTGADFAGAFVRFAVGVGSPSLVGDYIEISNIVTELMDPAAGDLHHMQTISVLSDIAKTNDLPQPTSTKQPVYDALHESAYTDGVDDRFDLAVADGFAEVFFVGHFASAQSDGYIAICTNGNSPYDFLDVRGGSSIGKWRLYRRVNGEGIGGQYIDGNLVSIDSVYHTRIDSAALAARSNLSAEYLNATGVESLTELFNQGYIGSSQWGGYANLNIKELVFTKPLTPALREQLITELMTDWGIV